ncbi:hypothetical protein GJ496_002855 [Pomphorhynchus laevis]|nr:hypothetical protein GJ496_002855 [Pomphorhynchus laevis]
MDVKRPNSLCTYSFNGYDDFLRADNNEMMQAFYDDGATIKFWMRVGLDPEPKSKRQILCESDKSNLNRQHFSVFVQYDLLTLIFNQHPMNALWNHEFFPSEWSWNISQYQDGNWHIYNIIVELPNVELIVDTRSTKLHKVVNEMSMSNTKLKHKQKDTEMTIGACWHGKSEKYVQNFYGDLAALRIVFSYIKRNTCYKNCSQRLEMENEKQLTSGTFAFNGNKSVVILRSSDENTLYDLISSIKYIRSDNPIPLSVYLNGTIICENMPKLRISELWLRGTETRQEITSTKKSVESILNPAFDGSLNNLKTTPGYVYSGWLVAVIITLASGLVIGTLVIAYNNRQQIKHHQCPTDDFEWDDVNFITNPLKTNRIHKENESYPDNVMTWTL